MHRDRPLATLRRTTAEKSRPLEIVLSLPGDAPWSQPPLRFVVITPRPPFPPSTVAAVAGVLSRRPFDPSVLCFKLKNMNAAMRRRTRGLCSLVGLLFVSSNLLHMHRRMSAVRVVRPLLPNRTQSFGVPQEPVLPRMLPHAGSNGAKRAQFGASAGKEADEALAQSYCPLPHMPLEEEWAAYLASLPRPSEVPTCASSPQLATVERRGNDVFLETALGVCGSGRLLMTWMNESMSASASGAERSGSKFEGRTTTPRSSRPPGTRFPPRHHMRNVRDRTLLEEAVTPRGVAEGMETKDITSLRTVLLPADSVVLYCQGTAQGPSQLILEPRLKMAQQGRARDAEERYRRWRAALPADERRRRPAARPNIVFLLIDSLSKGLAPYGLPETMRLLSELRAGHEGGGVAGESGGEHAAYEFLRFNVGIVVRARALALSRAL